MFVMICFFFNDTATTEIYTLSLHDALPILGQVPLTYDRAPTGRPHDPKDRFTDRYVDEAITPLFPFGFGKTYTEFTLSDRSEEHTSELQSRQYLVCRLLLEKKNNNYTNTTS